MTLSQDDEFCFSSTMLKIGELVASRQAYYGLRLLELVILQVCMFAFTSYAVFILDAYLTL